MQTYNLFSLLIALSLLVTLVGTAVSVLCLIVGQIMHRLGAKGSKGDSARMQERGDTLAWGGRVAALISAIGLTVACGVLIYCFMTGDQSLEYVLEYHSDASGDLAWLYKLSGLWAGREGSLLFWAWLISLFNAVVALRDLEAVKPLDNMAVMVGQVVLAAFVGVLLFSESNMPFTVTPDTYFDAYGNLTASASALGMNSLLEHWAMAIHPPTLFVGYAGLTIPFSYAIAALIVNDPSKEWVARSTRYTLFSWLFLGVGIGLGAVWAYVVLGWGGYWGWDPVENASLLSWLVGVALIHSFTVYRQRGAFKRWSVMCACLTFAFVIVGTFISRSGIVQSVHAFEGDPVSLILFATLIVASVLAGIVGLIIRWKSFGPAKNGTDLVESMFSKDAAYYFNNVIMIVITFVLAYMTISSALPSWLPFGGQKISTGTFDAIAHPLGVLYLAILAICPLLSWGRTQGRQFWKRARVPGLCALVLFAVLMVYFFMYLLPSYDATVASYTALAAQGDTSASEMLSTLSPAWYYNGLAAVGFFVASVLFFNALFMLGRGVRSYASSHEKNLAVSLIGLFRGRASTYGGVVAHMAMAIILVGLIGSSMYVTEKVDYVGYDEETSTATENFTIKDYTLVYTGNSVDQQANGDDIVYMVSFDVYRGDQYVGHVDPAVQLVQSTQQQKLVASVISFPTEDLFVVYKGVDDEGAFALDVRVNPLISFVWVGFVLLMVGALLAFAGRRSPRKISTSKGDGALAADEGDGKAAKDGSLTAEAHEAPTAGV